MMIGGVGVKPKAAKARGDALSRNSSLTHLFGRFDGENRSSEQPHYIGRQAFVKRFLFKIKELPS
ncbi:hypothetical protein NKI34_27315 [Mesorhizobium sp. M0700]|uniref:hypothetical protein n=1 Tax=Mesorhizobium sp. M0700 TaxID=2956988 RepID=UPI0033374406